MKSPVTHNNKMKLSELKLGDVVKLTWLDAFGKGSWNDIRDVEEGLKNHIVCEIVGYYIKKDKNFVVLSMGAQFDPHSVPFLHLEFIPKGAVVEIRLLK